MKNELNSRPTGFRASSIISSLLSVILLGIMADTPQTRAQEIQLLVRGDDMGVCHAINEACIKSYREGIVRSVEVIVPGSWFLDAVKLLKENPGLDVGVHLCLTSEWERCKWRPLTHAPSLVDENGYFRPMTRQRKEFPPNTGFLDAPPKIEEVEKELRAQIEMAKRHLGNVSHVSAHMGAATATPELKAVVLKLAEEYKLRVEDKELKNMRGFSASVPSQRENALIGRLETLEPGRWLLVEHPGFDTPEMQALGHLGYENVAADRDGVTKAFTSQKVKDVIQKRGIKLISYSDLK
jgi:predicted glycoside hydrolase/deacetylase ChbG (UPF0249 family)